MGKKLLTALAAVIALMWVTHDPAGAAAAIRHLITALSAFTSHL
jgi:hypothetical protein